MTQPYDALLIVSFGGPEGMQDVMPFLENVLRGRNVPQGRMVDVARRYELLGGVSPINGQNRKLMGAVEELLKREGPELPVYLGNRNWHPTLADTLRRMRDDGVRRALAFFTSAYSSYSGCRQYLENIETAATLLGGEAPRIEKLRAYYNHPGFIHPNIENLRVALNQIPDKRRATAHVAFTAHSIPMAMAAGCNYEAQLLETCGLVARGAGHRNWLLAYQSRSGPPTQAWLEPDIRDWLTELRAAGTTDVVVAPVGFVSDHMEVLYDLDTEAKQHCDKLGLNMVRAATVGVDPQFISMVRELVLERMDVNIERRYLGTMGPNHDVCRADCCPSGPGIR